MNFEGFLDGLSIFFVGITMVFIALFTLIFLIHVVGKIVIKVQSSHINQAVVSTPKNDLVENTPIDSVEMKQEKSQEIDELELVAVITATIAASIGTTSDKLYVRSLRKVNR